MRYFIRFSYDGSRFYGFQRLNEEDSVQKKLEEALTIINKEETLIKGCSRTDACVHSNGSVAHFDLEVSVPEERLMKAINRIVKPYIYVYECKKVNDDFHARFSVVKKKYVYKIWTGEYDPKLYDYYLMYPYNIEIDKLRSVADLFIGEHNFKSFVAGSRLNNNAVIYDINFIKKDNEILIEFIGKSFYRYMVRNLVGAMLDYNKGKCTIEEIRNMLKGKKMTLTCANPRGLYLDYVYYE